MLIIFTVLAIFIQSRTIQANETRNRDYVTQLKNVIFNEIDIAESMPTNYSKEFYLPIYIDGDDYTLQVLDGIELVIYYRNEKYVYFFYQDFDTSSDLHSGYNKVEKTKVASNINYLFSEV
jgi:hypothetical protein